jgi:hypothetical protein
MTWAARTTRAWARDVAHPTATEPEVGARLIPGGIGSFSLH